MPARFLHLFLGLESLAARAVVTGVNTFVNVPRVKHRLDELLAADVMPLFTRLDEVVVRDIERPPDLLKIA